jgi:hypothetical protein
LSILTLQTSPSHPPPPTAETGLSLRDTEFGLVVFIMFLLFAAVNEGSGKFVDDQ